MWYLNVSQRIFCFIASGNIFYACVILGRLVSFVMFVPKPEPDWREAVLDSVFCHGPYGFKLLLFIQVWLILILISDWLSVTSAQTVLIVVLPLLSWIPHGKVELSNMFTLRQCTVLKNRMHSLGLVTVLKHKTMTALLTACYLY